MGKKIFLYCILLLSAGCSKEALNTKLLHAVHEDNYELVKQCIEDGADVNYQKGNFEISEVRWPETPIVVALVQNHNEKIVRLLYDHGADPGANSSHKHNLLFYVKDPSLCEEWIQKNHLNPNQLTIDNATPLIKLAEYPEVIKVLLENHADPNGSESMNLTPLINAIIKQQFSTFELLLNAGANIEQKSAATQCSPVHFAAEQEDSRYLETLISKGCQVNVQDLWGSTPLHYAFINDLPENVDILLEAGADPTIRDKDNYLYNEEEIPSEPIKNMVDFL